MSIPARFKWKLDLQIINKIENATIWQLYIIIIRNKRQYNTILSI